MISLNIKKACYIKQTCIKSTIIWRITMNELILVQNLIYDIKGHKVMLDADLAKLYGVEVKRLNEAVKRNQERFPSDFMFQVTDMEWGILKSQIATSSSEKTWGGRRTLPYVFTEHGVLMLSSVLNSQKAIEINITIMRAFVQLRTHVLQRNSQNQEIKELKQMLLLHIDHTDTRFNEDRTRINQIIQALNNLIEHPKPKRRIGFLKDEE